MAKIRGGWKNGTFGSTHVIMADFCGGWKNFPGASRGIIAKIRGG